MFWLLMAGLVTGAPPPDATHQGFVDAARLQATCVDDGPQQAAAGLFCLGYVMGVTDQLLARPARRGGPAICPPPGFTGEAAVQAVVRHGRFAADANDIGAADFVRFALEDAYPCRLEGGSSMRLR